MVFTKKSVIQKITIVLVVLMLFNFIVPNLAMATDDAITENNETAIEKAGKVLFVPIRGLIVMCGDAVMNGLQYLFVSNEKAVQSAKDTVKQDQNFLGEDGETNKGILGYRDYVFDNTILSNIALELGGFEDRPNFKYTPQSIFEGSIKFFNINFISGGTTTSSDKNSEENKKEETNSKESNDIKNSSWFKAYEKNVNLLKDEVTKAHSEGNDTRARAALQILSNMGVSGITGIAQKDYDVSLLSYTPQDAKVAVKNLTTRYYNGENIYSIFAFDKSLTSSELVKNGINIIDTNTSIVGMLGIYNKDVGVQNSNPTMGPEIDYDKTAPVNVLHNMIASWYKLMRNIALIFLLSILVYVGIRIMISSTAADTAKYKKMLIDWVVAICILFALHYIMAFTNAFIDMIVNAFSSGSDGAKWVDPIFGSARLKLQGDTLSDQIFYTVLYFVLVIYTIVFTWYYLKRVVYAAFLTLIAPLVSLTYPLDRMGDGKSQAFNFWLKEYIANAIVQPVHLLIYTILISSVISLAGDNQLYAIVVLGAMIPTEKFIREMFGLNSQKGPGPAGNFAGGALAMHAFGKLMHGKPPIPKGHLDKLGGAGNGTSETEKKPKIKTPKDANSSDYEAFIDEGEELVNGNKGTLFANPALQKVADDQFKDFTGSKKEGDSQSKEDGESTIPENSEEDTTIPQISQDNESDIEDEANISTPQNREETTKIPLDSQSTQAPKASQNKDNGKLKRIKPSAQAKRIAKNARNQRYYGIEKKQLKSIGKGALSVGKGLVRGAGVAMGVAAGATVAVGATIASGDPNKLGTNLATGVLAGAKGGKTVANFAIGTTGAMGSGVINGINDGIESRQLYKDTLMKEDREYKKYQERKQQHKASKSLSTRAAIKAHYGYSDKNKEDRAKIAETQGKIEEFMNFGVNNAETAMRAMDLMDSHGLTEKQAKMAALQSERFEKDDDARREVIRKQMTDAFLKGYVSKGVNSEEALERAMADSHAVLANADRIHGVKEAEVGRQEKEYMKMKEYEKARRRTEAREAAQMNAQEQQKSSKENS